ncbi:NADH-ubiquinone oxidoreductase-F iron-sulfur binding region domain-containing protein [Kineococcus rhizosphaerae]|uniref:NADH:ubiquinone oxidoreductase subunit F (NADH-binding) n=1 Tax=Kineococcus rhizosphaerae TaxID=559628 RepID=A0A2T0R336_9ACTN|nr:NADH-ubiquinone oxidoreductase-F iron-sulfur binding region domain-containing protein [Kineococcus rhizosphaerae]PRY14478.1 NADH:ubiquinone oxidoreductase subunit F (NADH-binding) [Kineococcus rhizosphaerae]
MILPRQTPDRPWSLDRHLAEHGTRRVPDLLDLVHRSGLRGRGGAARLVADELVRVRDEVHATGRPGVVVVNGVEGEPLSRKDVTLLATVPHLVLDGALAAAGLVGATDVVVCTAEGPVLQGVRRALAQRPAAPVRLHAAPAAAGFVAGQESAVVAHLDGFAARPRGTGVPLWRKGLAGRPTVVKNVETLARLGHLAAHGHQPDTVLLTLAAPSGPRVVEVSAGTPLDLVLTGHGLDARGGALLGGFHGTWLGPADLGTPLTVDGVRAGVVRPVAAGECALGVCADAVRFLAGESVRQCGPCTFGMPRLADLTGALAGCRLDAAGLRELRRTVGLLADRGACRHPDASARTVAGALVAFADEVDAHLAGACVAGRAVAA